MLPEKITGKQHRYPIMEAIIDMHEVYAGEDWEFNEFLKKNDVSFPDVDFERAIEDGDITTMESIIRSGAKIDYKAAVFKVISKRRWRLLTPLLSKITPEEGLLLASEERVLKLMKFFIHRGATNFTEALALLNINNTDDSTAIILLIKLGAEADYNRLLKEFVMTTRYYHVNELLDILIEKADIDRVLFDIENNFPDKINAINFLEKKGALSEVVRYPRQNN